MTFNKTLVVALGCVLLGTAQANFYLGHVPQARDFCYIKSEAEYGDPIAQEQLGVMYAYGVGVDTDLHAAIKWWRAAAQQGDADAMYNLGNAYAAGLGVRQNKIHACKLFRESAAKCNAAALTRLGDCYAAGIGMPK